MRHGTYTHGHRYIMNTECPDLCPVCHVNCCNGVYMLPAYLLTGYRIYSVVRRLKYRKYACASSALYLQHPVSRYRRICTDLLRSYFLANLLSCCGTQQVRGLLS